jgi:PAS domain S-box-containing protein
VIRDIRKIHPQSARGRAVPTKATFEDRRFELLVDAVTDYAIYMLDIDGKVASWNSGAARIKGYSAEEVLGRHFSMFFTEEDVREGKPAQALAEARRAGRCESEGWRVRKDGTRFWVLAIIDAIRDPSGAIIGFAKVTRDITERRESQEALERAREQLFQSQKMEAIGQLTGGVAHDFNNLLAVILSGLSLIERQAGDNAKIRQLVLSVREAAHRGEKLIKQLLAFSRHQSLRTKVINAASQLREICGLVERVIRGDIRLVADIPSDLYPVRTDPSQLELAMLNVCLNARDAMPNGGTLTIRARNVPARGPDSVLPIDSVAVSIVDTGTGIPEAIQQKVFEPFFTTKEVGKGSGLGLSQAYGFATQTGSSITLQSKVGVGTTVTFHLPAVRPGADGLVAGPSSGQEPKRDVILLVEDHPQLAELTMTLLEEAGYGVKVVQSAAAALDLLRRGERVDLVFSDVVMPGGLSGVDLAQQLEREFSGLPVLLTTGYSEVVTRAEASRLPIISKPYDAAEAIAMIADLLTRTREGEA